MLVFANFVIVDLVAGDTRSAHAKSERRSVRVIEQLAAMERAPGGFLDTTMRLLVRKNSVYIAFILTGALVGERVVDYGINKVWESNNVGKRFEDIPKLGSRVEES